MQYLWHWFVVATLHWSKLRTKFSTIGKTHIFWTLLSRGICHRNQFQGFLQHKISKNLIYCSPRSGLTQFTMLWYWEATEFIMVAYPIWKKGSFPLQKLWTYANFVCGSSFEPSTNESSHLTFVEQAGRMHNIFFRRQTWFLFFGVQRHALLLSMSTAYVQIYHSYILLRQQHSIESLLILHEWI